MTIFQIECFLTVAEFLNFAKAAEQMNISQPAITRQIQSLENELGGKLFQRSTRVVRLTENGHESLCKKLLRNSLKREYEKRNVYEKVDYTGDIHRA